MENREGFCSVDFSCLKRQVHLFSPTFLLTFIHLFMAHWKSRISAHSSTCSISPPYPVSQDKWSADRWRSGVSGKTGRKGKDGQKRKIMESHWVISRRDSEWEEGKRRKACIKVWKLQKRGKGGMKRKGDKYVDRWNQNHGLKKKNRRVCAASCLFDNIFTCRTDHVHTHPLTSPYTVYLCTKCTHTEADLHSRLPWSSDRML